MSSPSNNPVVRGLQVALTGVGYNFYDDRNRARADDLLVRQHAGSLLTSAGDALKRLEADFRADYVPAATRENPYPPADTMAKLKAAPRLREHLSDLETQIRSMATPTQDRIWWRFRQELPLLEALIGHDYGLIRDSQTIADFIEAISAADWHSRDIPAEAAPLIHNLETSIRSRVQFLQLQGPL